MARVRYRIRLVMTVIISLLVVWILQRSIFHDATGVSQPNTEKQLYERDYVLHQKRETEQPKFRQTVQNYNPKIGEVKIFVGGEAPPKGSKMVSLKTLRGNTPIFVYPPEVDNMISSRVRDYGTWEEDMLNATGNIFLKNPHLTFLDLGCNIGVYSLFIAKLGFKVVSVDPVIDNMKLLSESLRLGNLATNVTLVNNAISDTRRDAFVVIPKENVGGAYISDGATGDGNSVKTIVLDDLSNLLKGKKIFIKMDIEGHEHRALSSGKEFFQSVDVKGILMEWVHHRYKDTREKIIDILVTNGLLPYEDAIMNKLLNPDRSHRWPENVFWFKR